MTTQPPGRHPCICLGLTHIFKIMKKNSFKSSINKQSKRKKKVPGRLDSQLPSGETEAQTGSQLSCGETEAGRTDTFIEDQTLNLGRKERAGKSPPSPPCYCHPGPASVSLPSQMVRTLMGDSSQPPSGPCASGSARISLIRLCAASCSQPAPRLARAAVLYVPPGRKSPPFWFCLEWGGEGVAGTGSNKVGRKGASQQRLQSRGDSTPFPILNPSAERR